ncbi:MAG: TetR family transcriptional regulator [Planctomycetota bacterium]
MARKTKEEALATRNRILDAAEAMFCTRGVARTSLHEIAEGIALTRGAVYWHFRDKYDLLLALWERAMLPLDAAFDEIDAEFKDDPLARIRLKGTRVFHRIAHDERTRNLLMILLLRCEMVDEVAAARDHILGCREECLGKMAHEFRQAVARGQLLRGTNPERTAIGLHALVDGLAYHWLLDPSRFDLERAGADLLEGFLRGIAPSGAVLRPAAAPPRSRGARAPANGARRARGAAPAGRRRAAGA